MDRRDFVKAVALSTWLFSSALTQLVGENANSYESDTISVKLAEGQPGITSIYLTEKGDADYAIIEAFYWTTVRVPEATSDTRMLLHKEATTPVGKGVTMGTEVALPLADIVFLRVKELNLLHQSEFGDVPKKK